MIEYKFRVWDKENKILRTVAQNDNFFISFDGRLWGKSWFKEDNGKMTNISDRYTIQQYIGLKDKTGKEIYEGDIIRIHPYSLYPSSDNNDHIDVVKDLQSFFENKGYCEDELGEEWISENMEIVGNIYENSEEVDLNAISLTRVA